jgi:hypothetical protein
MARRGTYLFQFGFLRKREDGSTSMTLLNPDNDGISKALFLLHIVLREIPELIVWEYFILIPTMHAFCFALYSPCNCFTQ